MMNDEIRLQAEDFMKNETEFHLGFLPTEQSNPITRHLDKEFEKSTRDGLRCLQRADREVLPMARKIFRSDAFAQMVDAGYAAITGGKRIVFSGCGATGRLSILLESMWREFFSARGDRLHADAAASIMTGGDFALIRSVESFEDYQVFGRRQVADLGMTAGDVLVAITEGGETSSVIGTVKEAADRGCRVFLLFNNPAELLREKLVRCREVIDDPRVTVLDLCCGPMGIAGSTRMQATTSEQLVAGALLEELVAKLLPGECKGQTDWADGFEKVLRHLESDSVLSVLADHLDFEVATYQNHGKVTYFVGDYLLDIFTDTTERSPTFMLPPFKLNRDKNALPSWAFVKDPRFSTPGTWENMLHRAPRCISWTPEDYRQMNAGEKLISNPPTIDTDSLYDMQVGAEAAPERHASAADAAVAIVFQGAAGNASLDAAYSRVAAPWPVKRRLEISAAWQDSPLHLLHHMAVKLAMNNISSGTMVKMGRVAGNWMSWVAISNKKLIDRAIRLVSELAPCSYAEACFAIFEAAAELDAQDWTGRERPSAVQYVLARLSKHV